MVDFIVEFTLPEQGLKTKYWIAYANSSTITGLGGSRCSYHLMKKDILKRGVESQFQSNNNEAEYEIVLTSLRIAKALGAKEFKLKTDSKLVVGQTTNEYEGERGKNAKELKTNSTVS